MDIASNGSRPGVPVEIRNLSCHYGPVRAVNDVSLSVGAGEFVSLLGPSGSGKTTILMNIAGFERLAGGEILVGGHDISHTAPHRRELGVVFQRYALFPHMSVADNIEYPLKMKGVSRRDRAARMEQALELVGLQDLGRRKPAQLSGGQQQRVALARVLVYRPPLILFDEPLGALDRKLREQVQLEIRRLNKELGITMMFVTHDQEEALIMSDKIALLKDGRIEQFGTGRELYDRPRTEFAAGFLGRTNVYDSTIVAVKTDGLEVVLGTQVLTARHPDNLGTSVGGQSCRIAIRPEKISVVPYEASIGPECLIKEVVFSGATTYLTGDVHGQDILIQGLSSDTNLTVQPGDRVALRIDPQSISVLPAR